MAQIPGPLTTLNHALPLGLDPARLAQGRFAKDSKRNYEQMRQLLAARIDARNSEKLAMWGPLIGITTDDYFEYPTGGSIVAAANITDLDRVQPMKAETVGHMIDLQPYGVAIGGSDRYFRDAREVQVLAAIQTNLDSLDMRLEQTILTRAMTSTETLLGSSGYSVGFASASASLSFTPPSYGGTNFASSHTHYVGYDTGSKTMADVLDGLAVHVNEHGHQAPFNALVSQADVALFRALASFVLPVSSSVIQIDRGGGTTGPAYFTNTNIETVPSAGGSFIGQYLSARGIVNLYASTRIPTGYVFLYKTFGMNDPRNPIAVRVHPEVGFGAYMKQIPNFDTTWPVKAVEVHEEFGVSAGRDRTSAAAGYLVSGGTWANPTIA